MRPEDARAIYDKLCPGWRDAKLVSGERIVSAPYREDRHPSLHIHEEKLTWIDRTTGEGGGAFAFAVRVLGEPEARRFMREIGSGGAPSPEIACNRAIAPDKQSNPEGLSDCTPSRNPKAASATLQPPALTLEEYAKAKQLPAEFLAQLGLTTAKYMRGQAVRIPYYELDGSEGAVRYRLKLEKGDGPDDRFRWRKNSKPTLYGVHRIQGAQKAGRLLVVEGESDTHTALFHGIPAVGVPGASCFTNALGLTPIDFAAIDRVYVIHEPDTGGDSLVKAMRDVPELKDRLHIVELPNAKDLSELHLQHRDHAAFKEALELALSNATPASDLEREEREAKGREAWGLCDKLAIDPNILDRVGEQLEALGVVGNLRLAKLTYLAITSRLFDRPVSIVAKGQSSSGKTFETQKCVELFPDEAVYVLTAMSEHALVYGSESLEHRMLVIYEASGLGSDTGSYLIRSLISEGCIKYDTVEQNESGVFETRHVERKGPTGLILTTTALSLHPENETRMLSVPSDDTQAHTRMIMDEIAIRAASGDAGVISPDPAFPALQTWLAVIGERRVVVPFARALSRLIPPVAIRLRRDLTQLFTLIRAHALLHQCTRERDEAGCVVATPADYAAVLKLVGDIMGEAAAATVSTQVRETVHVVEALIEASNPYVTTGEIGKKLGLDGNGAWRRAKTAAGLGYLENTETRERKPGHYILGDDLPEEREFLPSPEAVARRQQEGEVIAVGVQSQTDRDDSGNGARLHDCTPNGERDAAPTDEQEFEEGTDPAEPQPADTGNPDDYEEGFLF